MPKTNITDVFFLPPMAMARLGGSDVPLESFSWAEDPSTHGGGRTVIIPEISLEVQEDGSVSPYLPDVIRLRDSGLLRPVAPFFELWATVQQDTGPKTDVPLTLDLLEEAGGSLEGVSYTVTVANRKAARRTGDDFCAFEASATVRATDYRRVPLLAFTPHMPGTEPLVFEDRPIPLGHFQVIRPVSSGDPTEMGVEPAVGSIMRRNRRVG